MVGPVLALATLSVVVPVREKAVLHVFADVTLREAASAIERRYEASDPRTDVRFTFGSSGKLAEGILEKGGADVFVSAGTRPLNKVQSKFTGRRTFARTQLAIVTPAEREEIKGLTEVAQAQSLLMPVASDPAHRYANIMFAQSAQAYGRGWLTLVERHMDDSLSDVRAVLAKVAAGEAEAGIVYATDARAHNKVRSVSIPPGLNVTVPLFVAAARESRYRIPATRFTEFLFSKTAQTILSGRGFESPLKAVPELPVLLGGESIRLIVDKLDSLPQATATVGGERYRGADLRSILRPAKGTRLRIVGADGLTVTIPLAEVRREGAILIRMPSQNLQVILPGQPRTRWVRWVRQISVL